MSYKVEQRNPGQPHQEGIEIVRQQQNHNSAQLRGCHANHAQQIHHVEPLQAGQRTNVNIQRPGKQHEKGQIPIPPAT